VDPVLTVERRDHQPDVIALFHRTTIGENSYFLAVMPGSYAWTLMSAGTDRAKTCESKCRFVQSASDKCTDAEERLFP